MSRREGAGLEAGGEERVEREAAVVLPRRGMSDESETDGREFPRPLNQPFVGGLLASERDSGCCKLLLGFRIADEKARVCAAGSAHALTAHHPEHECESWSDLRSPHHAHHRNEQNPLP